MTIVEDTLSSKTEDAIIKKAAEMLEADLPNYYSDGELDDVDPETMCFDALYRFSRFIKNGQINVWRMITAPMDWKPGEVSDGKVRPLGQFWSWDERHAEAHWGDFRGNHVQWLIHATIAVEDVDWPVTVMMNANPSYEDEREIRLIDGRKVHLHWFQQKGKPETRVAVDQMMEDAICETEINPADELKCRVADANLSSRVSIIPLANGAAEITGLEAPAPGNGQGRQTMVAILAIADELGVTLEANPVWDEALSGLAQDDLEKWYVRLGFRWIPNRSPDWDGEIDEYMVRRPRKRGKESVD